MLLIIIPFTAGVVSQRAGFSNFIAKPIIMDGLGIVKRQVLSMFTKPDQITLDIKEQDNKIEISNNPNPLAAAKTAPYPKITL